MPHYEEVHINNHADNFIFMRAWLFTQKGVARHVGENIGHIVEGSSWNHSFCVYRGITHSSYEILGVMFADDPSHTDIGIQIEKVVVAMGGGLPIERDVPEIQKFVFQSVLDSYSEFRKRQGKVQRNLG